MKRNPTRPSLVLAAALLGSLALYGCGASSGGGDLSDEEKIRTMQKAHEAPLGPGGGGAAGTPPAPTGG